MRVPLPWTASGRLLLGHLSCEGVLALVPAATLCFVVPRDRPEKGRGALMDMLLDAARGLSDAG